MPSITGICTAPRSTTRTTLDQNEPSEKVSAKLANPVKTVRVGPKPRPELFFW
ncbi:hypothetical protein ACQ86D_04300 [Streptomyces galilaeus]